jgi:vacuolar-type H+-ATPase subunit C/Vma6
LDTEYQAATEFQRRLVQDLAQELAGCARHVGGGGGELIVWILARFQVENMKLLVRGYVNRILPEVLQKHLVPLPEGLALDVQGLVTAGSLENFVELLPSGTPRQRLSEAVAAHRDHPQPFFLEAALDCGYFQELLAKTRQLSGEDQAIVRPLVLQEANFFQFMLAVRGRFHYDLPSDALLAFRLPGISDGWFKALLTAPDMLVAAKSSIGIVFDELPVERGSSELALEALAWKRFLRLANGAFRRDHMGLGAAIGYAGLRRVETANLITLSEGIRTGMGAEAIRARLVPRTDLEGADV